MSRITLKNVGHSPRDTSRTRRLAQRLAKLQLDVDGRSIVIGPDGALQVNVAFPLVVEDAGVSLALQEDGGLIVQSGGLAIDPGFVPDPGPGGACCEILVADGISDPPVMLTNEEQDDFLYGVPG